ncbi:hypothetical protein IFM89_018385 [Coptis chinensis]|uniref:SHSP domain-containing protein n=1 Tax=Coptis chinensis TaxID=261450 RepID=A0A835HKY9_9MAGN|nr:hypothetical protein IFM89_018385 [Coptis chinensis]
MINLYVSYVISWSILHDFKQPTPTTQAAAPPTYLRSGPKDQSSSSGPSKHLIRFHTRSERAVNRSLFALLDMSMNREVINAPTRTLRSRCKRQWQQQHRPDIKEYPNYYVFVIDMPGLKSGDIKVPPPQPKKPKTIEVKIA